MENKTVNVIILAAGKGTRMNSSIPKVLHKVADKTLLSHVIDSSDAFDAAIYVIVGHQAEVVKQSVTDDRVHFVEQKEQLGTGHAIQQATPQLSDSRSTTLILSGDCPLIQADTLKALIDFHESKQAAATILSTHMTTPTGYGRILRDEDSTVLGIREEKDCSDEQRLVTEINSGFYAFDTALLVKHITELDNNNKQSEYYLTDIIEILKKYGHSIYAHCIEDSDEVIGINSPQDLAKVNDLIKLKLQH